jgi:DNA-binding NarL/FixJ family response regulator
MTVRVLIADDEAMVRAGIRSILATDPGIDVVAEAAGRPPSWRAATGPTSRSSTSACQRRTA